MKSIQTKVISFVIVAMVILSVLLTGMGVIILSGVINEDTEIMVRETGRELSARLNNELGLVEQTTGDISEFSKAIFDKQRIQKDSDFRNEYISQMRNMARSVSKSVEGAMSVYFRFDPEYIGNGTEGFFMSRSTPDEEFKDEENTDILAFNSDDDEHVGWFFQPKKAGKPIWLEPYYNRNIGFDMISYVIPYYDKDTFIGVIGIDINFREFISYIQNLEPYESAQGRLLSVNTGKMFNVLGKYTIDQEAATTELYELTKDDSQADKIWEAMFDGVNCILTFNTLKNDMRVLVYTTKSDVNFQRNKLVFRCVGITISVLFITTIVVIIVTQRIVKPLRQLNDAARKFAEGDWTVEIKCNTNDEVKQLTDSILIMADNTRNYIKEVNRLAYKDGLTMVKNKNYYLEYVSDLAKRQEELRFPYAVVVMDVNGLKEANDNFGHENGDGLLLAASRYICETYNHSPIFRIGGDEFVAILIGEDYENRHELLSLFRENMSMIIMDKGKSEMNFKLSIASGMAEFPVDGDEYDTVFNVADSKMYDNKKSMKKI